MGGGEIQAAAAIAGHREQLVNGKSHFGDFTAASQELYFEPPSLARCDPEGVAIVLKLMTKQHIGVVLGPERAPLKPKA